jgi:hypothetical protein
MLMLPWVQILRDDTTKCVVSTFTDPETRIDSFVLALFILVLQELRSFHLVKVENIINDQIIGPSSL